MQPLPTQGNIEPVLTHWQRGRKCPTGKWSEPECSEKGLGSLHVFIPHITLRIRVAPPHRSGFLIQSRTAAEERPTSTWDGGGPSSRGRNGEDAPVTNGGTDLPVLGRAVRLSQWGTSQKWGARAEERTNWPESSAGDRAKEGGQWGVKRVEWGR